MTGTKRYKKSVAFLLTRAAVLMILFVLGFFRIISNAKEPEEKTVRVAFPIQAGLTEIGENGEVYGYTCEFLDEVAQYTGWNYEYVQVDGDINEQLYTLMDMLENGEVDLMGGMVYLDSLTEIYDFSASNYGISYSVLAVLDENSELTGVNYTSYGKLRVGVSGASGKRNEKLDQFALMSGIEIEQVFYYDSRWMELLQDKTVDAIVITDIESISYPLRAIARFAPRPFYFGVTKNRWDITNGLNMAIDAINEENPYFTAMLHDKYFGQSKIELNFTEKEKKYLETTGPLKVVLMEGNAPIQYTDEKTGEARGVSIRILNYIREKTGLQFDLRWADTYEEYEKLLSGGDIDLVMGMPRRHMMQKQMFRVGTAYLTEPVAMALNRSLELEDLSGRRLAVPYGFSYQGKYQGDVIYYDNMEECLDAVERGDADYCYGNGYSMQFYQRQKGYKKVVILPEAEGQSFDIGIGVGTSSPQELNGIINKVVKSLSEDELRNYLYESSYNAGDITLASYIRSNPLQAFLLTAVVFMTVLISVLLWKYYSNYKNRSRRKLENERYEQICELSNEYLFEYEIAADRLVLPEKSADLLGCSRIVEHMSMERGPVNCKNGQWVLGKIAQAREGTEEFYGCMPDGSGLWLRIVIKVICSDSGIPIYAVGKLVDIQKEKEWQERLIQKAQLDGLTGIYNPETTRKLAASYLQEGGDGALLILDVDHFKEINDTLGHMTGDRVLTAFAQLLKSSFRSDDIVGRLGGDEFLLFLKGTMDYEMISGRCTQVQELASQVELGSNGWRMTVSIGAAMATGGRSFQELYQDADEALYEVKKNGRNGFRIRNWKKKDQET